MEKNLKKKLSSFLYFILHFLQLRSNLLSIVIAEPKLEYSRSTELFESVINVDCDLVVMFVSFVTKSENLKKI